MIRYNSLGALRIVAAHQALPITKLVELMCGRAKPIAANPIARPAIDELADNELVKIFDHDGVRMVGITRIGSCYLHETEIACAQQVVS